jgi:hypothetical protein
MEVPLLNLLVRLLDFNRFERRTPAKHSVQNNSNGPIVNFVAVAVLALKYLRSKIIRCSTDSHLSFPFEQDLGSKTEITNL